MCWNKLVCSWQNHKHGIVYEITRRQMKVRCRCGKVDVTQELPDMYGEVPPDALRVAIEKMAEKWDEIIVPVEE